MRVFCTRCGTPQEIAGSPTATVTCTACGNTFTPQPPMPQPAKAKGMSGWVIALIVVGVVAVPCVGVLAAIAIPNFIRFSARSKQAECRSNLKSLFVSQKAFFQENDQYSPLLAEVGFMPDRANRYAYFAGPDGTVQRRAVATVEPGEEDTAIGVDTFKYPSASPIELDDLPPLTGATLGITGECPECEITMACAGNIDGDDTLDVWSISTAERRDAQGGPIAPGELHKELDDTVE